MPTHIATNFQNVICNKFYLSNFANGCYNIISPDGRVVAAK
jgi:hypothetical protein